MTPRETKFRVNNFGRHVDIVLAGRLEVSGQYLADIVEWLNAWPWLRRNITNEPSVGTALGFNLGIRLPARNEELAEAIAKAVAEEDIFKGAVLLNKGSGTDETPDIICTEGGVAFADPDQFMTVDAWTAIAENLTNHRAFLDQQVGVGLYENRLAYFVYDKSRNDIDRSHNDSLAACFGANIRK